MFSDTDYAKMISVLWCDCDVVEKFSDLWSTACIKVPYVGVPILSGPLCLVSLLPGSLFFWGGTNIV